MTVTARYNHRSEASSPYTMSLQEVIDERKFFWLKEQINYKNKSEVNSTFKFHIDVFRSVDDIEELNSSVYKTRHHQSTVKV